MEKKANGCLPWIRGPGRSRAIKEPSPAKALSIMRLFPPGAAQRSKTDSPGWTLSNSTGIRVEGSWI